MSFHKTRVRPLQFFSDYDKLRTSYITANQFLCGLSLACSAPGGLALSRSDMQRVADHYTEADKGVHYRRFCTDCDSGAIPLPPLLFWLWACLPFLHL